MKLVTFDEGRPGALVEGGVIDLSRAAGEQIMALPLTLRMNAVIERWNELRGIFENAVERERPVEHYTLRAPVLRPGKMLFAASNYLEGLTDGIPTPLDMFVKLPTTMTDPAGEVILPPDDVQLFFHEAELGIVIGKGGRRISPENAMEHIFGYACVNDISSWGLHGAPGGMHNKNFDTFLGFGPCVVTADEIADPQNLDVKLWVNDELRQNYNTSDMEHHIPELIAWASNIATLEPGDLIACGTNHGGIGPIQNEDVMRMTITGLGELRHSVRDPRVRRWKPGPDHRFENWVLHYKATGQSAGELFSARPLD